MPKSVNELLVTGEHRIFNFVESFMPLNMRKEAEYCVPAAFQVSALPKVKKLLDEKINLLVSGGKWLLETQNEDPYNQGMLIIATHSSKNTKSLFSAQAV